MRLTIDDNLDSNPISPQEPGEIFRTLRDLHEQNLSGDTSLRWEILTQVSEDQFYSLGAKGKFYHPDFGIIEARYVQFLDDFAVQDLDFSIGLGFSNRIQGPKYCATRDFSISSPEKFIGIVGSYNQIKKNEFGWAIVGGINLHSIKVACQSFPRDGDVFVWGADGIFVKSTNKMHVKFFGAASVVEISPGIYSLPPASCLIMSDFSSGVMAPQSDNLAAEIAALKSALKDKVDKLTFADTQNEVGTQIKFLKSADGFTLSRLESLIADESSLTVENQLNLILQLSQLNRGINEQIQNSQIESQNILTANIAARDRVEYFMDRGEFFASAARETSFSAAGFSNESLVQATISANSAVSAGLSAAAAEQNQIISSRVATNSINPNSRFLQYPDGAINAGPQDWTRVTGETFTNFVSQRVVGDLGNFALSVAVDQPNQFAGFSQAGFPQFVGLREGQQFLLKTDARLVAGKLSSACLGCLYFNSAGAYLGLLDVMFLSATPDSTGIVPGDGEVGKRYQTSKIIKLPPAATGITLFCLNSAFGFLTASAETNTIVWQEAGIFPAGVTDLASSKNAADISAANAAIAANQLTQAGINSANAQTINALSATVTANKVGQDLINSNTSALISQNQSVQAGINSATAASLSNVTTTVNQNTAAISTQQTSINGIQAQYTLAISINGTVVTGLKLIGSQTESVFRVRSSRFEIETAAGGLTPFSLTANQLTLGVDLRYGQHRLIGEAAGKMIVLGAGFGVDNNMLLWAGPVKDPSLCDTSDSIFHIPIVGQAIFRGGFGTGLAVNSRTTTETIVGASVTVGPYNSISGHAKQISVTYSFMARVTSTTNWNFTGHTQQVVIRIYRNLNGAGEVLITNFVCVPVYNPVSGIGIPGEPGIYNVTCGGSISFTDSDSPSLSRSYRAEVFTRDIPNFPVAVLTQLLTVTSTEE